MKLLLVVAVGALMALTACSSIPTRTGEAPQATHGYLAQAYDQGWADYLVLTRTDNKLSGTIDTAQIRGGTPSSMTVATQHYAVDGTTDGTSITLSTGILGSNLTGSYQGAGVSLSIPQTSGELKSMYFAPASQQDYNNLVQAFWKETTSENAGCGDRGLQSTGGNGVECKPDPQLRQAQQACATINGKAVNVAQGKIGCDSTVPGTDCSTAFVELNADVTINQGSLNEAKQNYPGCFS